METSRPQRLLSSIAATTSSFHGLGPGRLRIAIGITEPDFVAKAERLVDSATFAFTKVGFGADETKTPKTTKQKPVMNAMAALKIFDLVL
jgi:hypothetical protein